VQAVNTAGSITVICTAETYKAYVVWHPELWILKAYASSCVLEALYIFPSLTRHAEIQAARKRAVTTSSSQEEIREKHFSSMFDCKPMLTLIFPTGNI
jgi:hypothetical protein